MAMSPVTADHVTVHIHEGPETPSEAAGNYAGAAFLVGGAVLLLGMGIGRIIGAVKGARKGAAAEKEASL